MAKVLVVATSRKTRGGITSVVKAHEMGEQWKKYHCKWIETHRDGPTWRKLWYFFTGLMEYMVLLPFYDLVHIHFSEPSSAIRKKLFVILAKMWRKKVVIHFHSFSPQTTIESKHKKTYRYLFSRADCSIVLSKFWQNEVDRAFCDEEISSKIRVVYNPCMPIPIINDKSSCVVKTAKIILYAGTVNERKGYVDLLKGFARVANKHVEWIVSFAGNGEIEKGKSIARELGIEDRVRWLGWISGLDKDRAFRSASIFCLPSYAEGFPMGVLDAWSYGLPVITTPVGGIPDVAENRKNMLLFNSGDTEALASCLKDMIENEELRKDIAKESILLAKGVFNLEHCNKSIAAIYRDILRK